LKNGRRDNYPEKRRINTPELKARLAPSANQRSEVDAQGTVQDPHEVSFCHHYPPREHLTYSTLLGDHSKVKFR
jgi:hypothetical protein